MKIPQARVRIDFAAGSSVGPGKIELLEAIAGSGSLSAAARSLHMSYRRAWLLLHDVNESFPEPAARLNVGGRAGGGAHLTEFGTRLVVAYREFEATVQVEASRSFAGVFAAPTAGAKPGQSRRPLQRPLVPRPAVRKKRQA
ncbi:MAG: LysR family transcriptional regulator [Pseudomonadota bacterium]